MFKEKLTKIKDDNYICDFILEEFDNLFDEGKYDEVASILDDFEVSDFHDKQVPVTMMCFSNAVSPLLRKIPEKDRLDKLHLARAKFYDKCQDYYKDDEECDSLLDGLKPENYDDAINYYKKIFNDI